MNVQSVYSLLILSVLLAGCNNNSAITRFYDKTLKKEKLACISYTPESNNTLNLELTKLYSFNKNCPNKLTLTYKSNIVCNSPYNKDKKLSGDFPTAYITLEVRSNFKLRYSYYKDLTSSAKISDLKDAFDRLKEDIL